MNENRTPNYGLDAPLAVRNMLIVAALGIISLITRLLGVWSRQDVIAVIARPLIGAGLSCGAMALWMIYDSKIGKIREQDTYLNKIHWNGNEHVLDVGCGLGLFLIGAAKRLSIGRAVGIDKWQQEDLSGNNAAGTLRNAMIKASPIESKCTPAMRENFPSLTPASTWCSRAWRCTIFTTRASGRPPCAKSRACWRLAGACSSSTCGTRRNTPPRCATQELTDARCVQGVFSYR
jgi:hypothetical protein